MVLSPRPLLSRILSTICFPDALNWYKSMRKYDPLHNSSCWSFYPFLCFWILNFLKITVYIQYYFALVSGIQCSGWTMIEFTKCPPNVSSTHPAPHVVIATLLTVFPVTHFTSLWLFCSYWWALLTPCTSSTQSPAPSPPAAISLFSVSMSLLLFCSFYIVV